MPDTPQGSAAHPCSSCGRPRAECRTADQPFLSCCHTCARNDGDTHNAAACHYCGTTDTGERIKKGDGRSTELRPYGPGGSWVCYSCAFKTPEREAAAGAAFGALLDGAEAISPHGVAAIGQESGPVPFDIEEARRHGR